MLISDKSLPPYKRYYVDVQPKEPFVSLVNTISSKTGVRPDEVKKILRQLEYADKSGVITKGFYDPRLLDASISKCPPGADCPEDMMKYIKWGAIGVGTALVLMLGIKTMNILD